MAVLFFFTMIHSENSYTKYLFLYQITSSRCSLSSKGSFLPSLHILFLYPKQSVQSPPDIIFLISLVIPASSILLLPALMVKISFQRFLIGLIYYILEQLSYIPWNFATQLATYRWLALWSLTKSFWTLRSFKAIFLSHTFHIINTTLGSIISHILWENHVTYYVTYHKFLLIGNITCLK